MRNGTERNTQRNAERNVERNAERNAERNGAWNGTNATRNGAVAGFGRWPSFNFHLASADVFSDLFYRTEKALPEQFGPQFEGGLTTKRIMAWWGGEWMKAATKADKTCVMDSGFCKDLGSSGDLESRLGMGRIGCIPATYFRLLVLRSPESFLWNQSPP